LTTGKFIMEQKKLLLVAISVGVFLVIVIGAAILAAGSGNSAALAAASAPRPIPAGEAGTAGGFQPAGEPGYVRETAPRTPEPVDAAGLLKNPDAIPGLNPAPEGVPLQQNNFYINGTPEKFPSEETGEAGIPRTIITVEPKTAAGVPSEPPAGRAAPRPAAAPGTSPAATPVAVSTAAARPAQTAARPAQAAAPRPTQAASPAKAQPAVAKPAETAKVYDTYWVQTGSFSAKARAEEVKETLASKGISSIIENREIDGKIFYRVRMGPYTSEDEARHWRFFIKSIDGFEDSMVWKSQSRR
jgi:DedD protein